MEEPQSGGFNGIDSDKMMSPKNPLSARAIESKDVYQVKTELNQ
jgi:hypothetical protein